MSPTFARRPNQLAALPSVAPSSAMKTSPVVLLWPSSTLPLFPACVSPKLLATASLSLPWPTTIASFSIIPLLAVAFPSQGLVETFLPSSGRIHPASASRAFVKVGAPLFVVAVLERNHFWG